MNTQDAAIHSIENVIYRRIVKDESRRHMTLQSVLASAVATLKTLQ